jgi:5-methylthioribose kinase
MHEIDAHNAADYLRQAHHIGGEPVEIRELAGGVSNIVLRVDVAGQPPFVLKQCRERLRVEREWRAPLKRIWVEVAALRELARLLPAGSVPEVRFVDRAQYLFGMTCAPEGSTTWKTRLLAGELDAGIARRVGDLLGRIHHLAQRLPSLEGAFAETSLFEHLRVDPYYRTTALVHPDRADPILRLIAAMQAASKTPGERTLVLGDYSPKNILLDDAGNLTLLDFECAHAGDPAFDLGFCLSHLMLKTLHGQLQHAARSSRRPDAATAAPYLRLMAGFWQGYKNQTGSGPYSPRGRRGIWHMAACLLARVDGKSPVEYLDPRGQDAARRLGRALLVDPNHTWGHALALARQALRHTT